MKEKEKRFSSILLIAVLVFLTISSIPAAAFAGDASEQFPYQYEGETEGYTAVKVSHPDVAPNAKRQDMRSNDGILDYVGNGQLSDEIGNEATSGDRGQNYTWSAIGYGDWVYTGTLYNAMNSTLYLMGSSLGHQYDKETMDAIINVLYNGDFYLGEEDGGVPGGTLSKINMKTGEVKMLLSKSQPAPGATTGQSISFRNACAYDGKLYFCGAVNNIPEIWQVDPETDICKKVYGMDPREYYAGHLTHISTGIRGLCEFTGDPSTEDDNELIVSSVCKGADGEIKPTILSSKNPEDGFEVIATYEDLFEYPAFHYEDSIYGGSIWEMVEYNGKLYVSICTGTPENKPDENTMRSFAVVCGEKQADGTWTWRPVIGDKADGAKYTFGIDPERTRAGAGVLKVYDGYLYIGEYNDEEIAMENIIFDLDFKFMNENFKQSVSLYRMDENEDIELVVGNPTAMFPEGGISGIASGFGHPENQYIWRMEEHDGKLYVGTFDTSSLLQPVGQFANMDIAHMSTEEWVKMLEFIRQLVAMTQVSEEEAAMVLSDDADAMPAEEEAKLENLRYLFANFDDEELAAIFSQPGTGRTCRP